MKNRIKELLLLASLAIFFSCSGGADNSSDTSGAESPDPVTEMDKSRYNLNPADEMLHEMQDSTVRDTLDTLGD